MINSSDIKLPKNILRVLFWMVDLLENNAIEYELTGGLAARCYGSKRKIIDIDFDLRKEELDKIARLVPENVVSGPRQYIDDGFNIRLLTLKKYGVSIDLSVAGGEKLQDKNQQWHHLPTNWKDKDVIYVQNRPIKIIGREELIAYKKVLNRAEDRADIREMERKKINSKKN